MKTRQVRVSTRLYDQLKDDAKSSGLTITAASNNLVNEIHNARLLGKQLKINLKTGKSKGGIYIIK